MQTDKPVSFLMIGEEINIGSRKSQPFELIELIEPFEQIQHFKPLVRVENIQPLRPHKPFISSQPQTPSTN